MGVWVVISMLGWRFLPSPSAGADHALLSFSFVCVASLGTVFTSAGGVFLPCTAPLSSAGIFLGRSSRRAKFRGTETQAGLSQPRAKSVHLQTNRFGRAKPPGIRKTKLSSPHPGSFRSRLSFFWGFFWLFLPWVDSGLSCRGAKRSSREKPHAAAEGFGFSTQTP